MKTLKTWVIVSLMLVGIILAVDSVAALERTKTNDPGSTAWDTNRLTELDQMIRQMRSEIKRTGETFEVGYTSALQYSVSELCTFNPDEAMGDEAEHEIHYDPGFSESIDDCSLVKALPSYYIGYYTPIRNGASCGAAWAFATVAVFEGIIKKKTGTSVNLSEQHVVSCNTYGYSCSGGNFAHGIHVNPGAVMESCFPYVAYNAPCKTTCPYPYKLKAWYYVGTSSSIPTTAAIKDKIYNYGSVGAAVYADSYFMAYTGGTFNHCVNNSVNHTVVLVGWDDTRGAWRLKNCWGTSWGESGLMWITYGCSKIGYGANYVVY